MTMDSAQNRVVPTTVRFTDGRTFIATTESVTEFFLHPVFLKYFLFCTLIYGLLDRGGMDTGHLVGFEIVMLWSAISLASLGWFLLLFTILRLLRRRLNLTVVYTPLVLLPLFLFTTTATYLVVDFLKGPPGLTGAEWTQEIVRDMIVILLMDMGFSQFVAPMHPLLVPQRAHGSDAVASPYRQASDVSPVTAAAPYSAATQAQPQPAAPDAAEDAAPRPMPEEPPKPEPLRFAGEIVPAEGLQYIRSEDHYLRIVTATRRVLTRGRLSDAIAQVSMRQGIQVNRSTWVSFNAIREINDEGGTLTLRLPDGAVERVSQSRRFAFQAALALRDKG